MRTRPGRRPVELWPPADGEALAKAMGKTIEINGWAYRATKSASPRHGVPWELTVTPIGENAKVWRRGETELGRLVLAGAGRKRSIILDKGETPDRDPNSIAVVEIPDVLWKQWIAPAWQDAVGIHFHEFTTNDVARIMYTVHKVPPDKADGEPPSANEYRGHPGTRIEATLVAPVVFSLDQVIAARVDPLHKDLAESRAKHEVGHAQISQDVLREVLRGPQTWNIDSCTGRRSVIAYYWKREAVGRSWQGYQGGVGKLATLRTSIALVPPTRWSMLLPIPPERITQKHIQAFNDAIVHPSFNQADAAAQDRFHDEHGEFEPAQP